MYMKGKKLTKVNTNASIILTSAKARIVMMNQKFDLGFRHKSFKLDRSISFKVIEFTLYK